MDPIVRRLFENRQKESLEEAKLLRFEIEKDIKLGVSLLNLVFDTKDKTKGVYDYIIDDAYPNAPLLKRKLLKRLENLKGTQKEYPYVRKIIQSYNSDFLRPGKSPIT